MENDNKWKSTIFLVSGGIGLLTGLAAAYLIVKKREETGDTVKLTTGDGARIGMGIVTLLKMIADSGK
ncbi:MAG: hypothetical protein AAGU17_08470 [Anaerolineaceae bacterium]|jgi:hypothetical protein